MYGRRAARPSGNAFPRALCRALWRHRIHTTVFQETAMSASIPPIVLHMIPCDEVLQEQEQPGKLTVVGLVSRLHWPEGSTASRYVEQLVTLLVLTGGHGTGRG